jgi:chaperonin GroEL
LREIGSNHVGEIGRVVASKVESTLYGDNSGEIVQDRIAALKSQIETEAVDAIREKLKDRLAKLEGKIAIFRIGGTTETTKEELEFRVEDSILATRAAVSHGIVPGGGTTLLELSKTIGLSDLTRNALREVFKQLLINANLPEQVKLQEALDAKPGYGFNLREGDELVDMVKAGILDPTLVVENIIRNACEMAGNLLTIGAMIVHEEKEG